ncbi:MAG: DUF4832 domain-containing protein [Bacteroidota bacterium]
MKNRIMQILLLAGLVSCQKELDSLELIEPTAPQISRPLSFISSDTITENEISADGRTYVTRKYWITSVSPVNEGASVTIKMNTSNVTKGTSIAYSVSGIDTSDITSGKLKGNFIIGSGGVDSVKYSLKADNKTEGAETLKLTAKTATLSISVNDVSLDSVKNVVKPAATSFLLEEIPYGDMDLLAPGRGANTFYTYTQAINIPDPNTNVWSLDNETRFNWSDLQNGPSSYTWANLDNQINTSIDKGQKFAFRVVTIANGGDGTISTGGGILGYPMFVHTGMQSESPKDWIPSGSGNMWVPNWNSNTYLSAWENFLKALADHVNSGSYKGIAYKNVLSRFDICGFGNYGEWHNAGSGRGSEPSGAKATGASLIRIVAANIAAFPNVPLIGNVDMFYGENDAQLGYYVLNASNNWGKIGFRNDHLGDAATFSAEVNDPRSNNGLVFSKELVKRWQYAPIIGETLNSSSPVLSGGSCQFWDFENEVRTLHITQFNNQNGTGVSSSCLQDNYRNASKASGYRLSLKGGSISGSTVSLNWSNSGVAPVYENWDVYLELRNGNTVVWSGVTAFKPKLFLPGTTSVNTTMGTVASGTYSLYVIVKDPLGYRKPLPLANKNRLTDGSYKVADVKI